VATKRSTFQKRQRETDLKDKARAKEARRAAKRDRNTPDTDAAAQAEQAQAEEIAAAIAAATTAAATIAHDARRAAATLPSPDDAPAPPASRSDRPR
jgi:hypothetical protein